MRSIFISAFLFFFNVCLCVLKVDINTCTIEEFPENGEFYNNPLEGFVRIEDSRFEDPNMGV